MNKAEVAKLELRIHHAIDNSLYGALSGTPLQGKGYPAKKFMDRMLRARERQFRADRRNVPTIYPPEVKKRHQEQAQAAALRYYQQLAIAGLDANWTVETYTAHRCVLMIARLPRTSATQIQRWEIDTATGSIAKAKVVSRQTVSVERKHTVLRQYYLPLIYAGWPLDRIALFVNLPVEEMLTLGFQSTIRINSDVLRKRLIWCHRTPEDIDRIMLQPTP